MQDNKNIDTIIFDAGGVLFYINERRNNIMNRVLLSMGYKEEDINQALETGRKFDNYYFNCGNKIVDWKDEKKWIGLRADVISKALDDDDNDLADKLKYLSFDTHQYTLFDETLDVLERLGRNYKLTVLSNATASLDWAFDYLDIRKYFDDVIISSYVKCEKPDDKIFHIALNKIDKSPENCIFIDDKKRNVEAARSIGIKAFHLQREEGMDLYDFEGTLDK